MNFIDSETDLRLAHARGERVTLWRNPLGREARLVFLSDMPATRVVYVIPAGGTAEIPARYDSAIRATNKKGEVIGGRGPHLVREGEAKPPKLHPSIVNTETPEDHPALPALLSTPKAPRRGARK